MVTYTKLSPQNGEPQRYSRRTQKKKKTVTFAKSFTSNDEPKIYSFGMQKKKKKTAHTH